MSTSIRNLRLRSVIARCGAALVAVVLAAGLVATASAAPASAAAGSGTRPQLTAGYDWTCALSSNGTVKCWGDNSLGSLGDGTTINHSVPTAVPGLTGVTSIAAGYAHACALLSGGSVECWGFNNSGQLGDGTTVDHHTPMAVPGLTGVTAISAGEYDTCALLSAGTVKCWGDNRYGGVGDGTTVAFRLVPTTVVGLSGVRALAGGTYFSCALLQGGAVKCWGSNARGQLGDGTNVNRNLPTDVVGLSGASGIAAGLFHTCAVLGSGGAECWGSNSFGELGDGTFSDRWQPVTVGGLSGVSALSAGELHTCALLTSGTVSCWGRNDDGQLGDNTTVSRSIAAPVSGLSGVTAIVAAGWGHTCALLTSGAAKCWGSNGQGDLGDNTVIQRNLPTTVIGLNVGTGGGGGGSAVGTMTSPASTVRLSTSIPVGWTDSGAPASSFDVRLRTSAWNAAPGTWTTWLSATSATSGTYAGAFGHTYCFGVRTHDGSGALSAWSARSCTAVPLRSDQLTYSRGWSKYTDAGAFGGFGFQTTTRGARMMRTGIVAQKLSLVVTKCATCGKVQVRWNGAVLKTLNLSRATTLRKVVLTVASFSTAQSGTLTVTDAGPNGSSVRIEGLAVSNG